MKQELFVLTQQELESMGVYPPFRWRQLFFWIHKKQVLDYEDMKNLPRDFKSYLQESYPMPEVEVEKSFLSADGTEKILFRLEDDYAEAVLMRYRHGRSLCLSTQVGCRMACTFCASGLKGLIRNLSASEMLAMFYRAVQQAGERISHLVLMGSGEPLDNYEEVLRFIRRITSEEGYHLSERHVTLSTSGVVPGIRKLAKEKLAITLSISLHAADASERAALMPVSRRWPLEELMEAAREYRRQSGRRVTMEYALIAGVNDSLKHAEGLANLLRGSDFHVNLIPINPVVEKSHKAPAEQAQQKFRNQLEGHGIHVTIRRELGSDIAASCGQLRNEALEQEVKGE